MSARVRQGTTAQFLRRVIPAFTLVESVATSLRNRTPPRRWWVCLVWTLGFAGGPVGAVEVAGRGDPTVGRNSAIVLDCNGNGTDNTEDIASGFSTDVNTNGIPDECDFTVCDTLWNGFGAYASSTPVSSIDYNGDGYFWQNPLGTATIESIGCEGTSDDRSVVVSGTSTLTDPTTGYVESEYLRTVNGALDCGSAIYTLTFIAKLNQAINSKVDFEYFLYDAKSGKRVVQLEFPATGSTKVPTAQRGKVLVRDPAGTTYFNTNVAIVLNTCMTFKIELNNVTNAVSVYVNDMVTPKVVTTRLDADAYRVDYFRIQAIRNLASSGPTTSRFCLDKVTACVSGPALMDWTDCNHNCAADFWDLANNVEDDCNTNSVPDSCDTAQNCACNGVPHSEPCIACNHDHRWQFETGDGFALGDIAGQQGWTVGAATDFSIGQIVAPGPPFEGQSGFSGQVLRLDPKTVTGPAQGVRGPRTHDEQPNNAAATADPDIEYWEVDIVADQADSAGNVFFVIWDECADSFTTSPGVEPYCAGYSLPTCLLIDRGGEYDTYAYFNAGVALYSNSRWAQELRLLSAVGWSDFGDYRAWTPSQAKHVTVRINNATGNVAYYAGAPVPGQLTPLRMWENAREAAPHGGDRQVLLVTTSTVMTTYWDSFRYSTDTDCDRDDDPDSYYLAGGVFYEPGFDLNQNATLDWCEDCNANCILDAVEIAAGLAPDCNHNGIPDACDVSTMLPLTYQFGCTPPGGKTPCTDYGCDWPFYTRQGGESLDANTNGVPDECEPLAPGDCDRDGDVDGLDFADFLDCLSGPGTPLPAGTGCACFDLNLDGDGDLADFAVFQGTFTGSR